MGRKVGEHELIIEGDEWGVRFDNGFVYVCDDEQDAEATLQMTGGEVVSRTVYVTEWELCR